MPDTRYLPVKCTKPVPSYPAYFEAGKPYQACVAGSGGDEAKYWVGIPGIGGHYISLKEFKECFALDQVPQPSPS